MAGKKQEIEASVGWDHPFVAMGFVPSHLLRQVWGFSESYWDKWQPRHLGHGRMMNGITWFHTSRLQNWLCNPNWQPEETTEGQSEGD